MYICQASSKQKAFKALVLPVLDYACTVWNPHTQKNILALEKIQNHGACWVWEVGSIPILQLGQSLLVNVAVSFIGLHFPPVESIYQ